MILTIIILSLFLITSVIINIYLFNGISIVEKKIETYEEWILNTIKNIENTYNRVKIIDDKQIFEKDDEVGVVFQNLKNTIEYLKNKVKNEED